MKQFQLKITSAVAIDGEIKVPGSIVTVDERTARDLLAREKAVADDSAVQAEAQAEEAEAEAEAPAAEAPAAAPAPAKAGKRQAQAK